MSVTPRNVSTLGPIQAHPPERRQRKKDCVVLYSCCCCCCCCLHSLGGIAGAIVGGLYQPASPPAREGEKKPLPSMALYWLSLLIALIVVGAGIVVLAVSQIVVQGQRISLETLVSVPASVGFGLGVSLILLAPAWLLAASVVMAIIMICRRDLRGNASYWASLGLMTLGSVVGSALGTGVMYGAFVLLSHR